MSMQGTKMKVKFKPTYEPGTKVYSITRTDIANVFEVTEHIIKRNDFNILKKEEISHIEHNGFNLTVKTSVLYLTREEAEEALLKLGERIDKPKPKYKIGDTAFVCFSAQSNQVNRVTIKKIEECDNEFHYYFSDLAFFPRIESKIFATPNEAFGIKE